MKHYLSETNEVLKSFAATEDGLTCEEASARLQKTDSTSCASRKKFLCL